jgi:ribosomal protein L4
MLKNITALLKVLDVKDALLMTDELDENLYLSSRNLYHVGVCDTQSIDPNSDSIAALISFLLLSIRTLNAY